MKRVSPLAEHSILGISAMIRDVELLTDRPAELEADILAGTQPLQTPFRSDVQVLTGPEVAARVGDLIVFKLKNAGAYPCMETLWGGRVQLEVGGTYIGVLCERGSTKLITAEFPPQVTLSEQLDLQFVAQGGGIGFATGYSPSLRDEYGSGKPSDVEVVGVLYDARQDRVLNTLDQARLCEPVALAPLPPCVLVLGVATDVGKTTAAAGLIHDLAQRYSCAAVKASGTGWYEDSLLHQQAGAIPALNFTFAGLPTTYYIPQQQFLNCMYRIMNYTAAPERIPEKYIHPDLRHRVLQKPNVIVVEHGGDFVWASIPYYLQDSALMASVRAIILCSESAMSLTGALDELESLGIINSDQLKVFASVPLINIEGFYKRIERHIQSGRIAGVFDINKPVITDEKDKRCDYSAHYDQILSRADLTRQVERAAGLKQS